MSKPGKTRPPRSAYPYFRLLETRWSDNDVYGHVNNVTYYSFFDTAVNGYLIERCELDIAASPVIGLVVETSCQFHAPIEHPGRLEIGVAAARIGRSSVIYDVGVFREGEDEAAANGRFVHVYVDRVSRRPTEIPEAMRRGLQAIAPT